MSDDQDLGQVAMALAKDLKMPLDKIHIALEKTDTTLRSTAEVIQRQSTELGHVVEDAQRAINGRLKAVQESLDNLNETSERLARSLNRLTAGGVLVAILTLGWLVIERLVLSAPTN